MIGDSPGARVMVLSIAQTSAVSTEGTAGDRVPQGQGLRGNRGVPQEPLAGVVGRVGHVRPGLTNGPLCRTGRDGVRRRLGGRVVTHDDVGGLHDGVLGGLVHWLGVPHSCVGLPVVGITHVIPHAVLLLPHILSLICGNYNLILNMFTLFIQ